MFKQGKKISLLSDEELMLRVRRGDRDAFENLYNRYYNKLVHFCKRLLFENLEVAEDLVQELFVKIINKPEAFNTEKVFSTWVYSVAKNMCYNHTRDEQNRQRLLDLNFAFNESTYHHSATDLGLLKKKIGAIFEQLSERDRLIFVLRFEHDLNIKVIADIAGIPEGTVKSGIFYMLKKVSVQLKEFKYEY